MEVRAREEKISMTPKKKNELLGIINGFGILLGLYLWSKSSHQIFGLVAVLLVPTIIGGIIIRLIPNKKQNNKSKNEITSKKIAPNKGNVSTVNASKNKLTDKELLSANIDTLSGTDFERLCYSYFEDNGFKPESTKVTGDHGVDLVIKDPNDGMKIAVQCKRWKDKAVGNNDLIKLYGGKRAYKCIGTLFITTSSYTNAAKDYSESVGMRIWNGAIVQDKIGKWQKAKLKKIG
jgi:restriction system protein